MKIEQMSIWMKRHNLLLNRIAIINQIHGCHYGYCVGYPCTVRYERGWYICSYNGNAICSWAMYDYTTLDSSYDLVDSLCNALWLVSSAGYLRVLKS